MCKINIDLTFSQLTIEMAELVAKRKGITAHELIQSYLDSPEFKKWLDEEEARIDRFKEVDNLFEQIDKATERLHEMGIEY